MPFQLIRARSTGRWDITPAMTGITSGQLIVEREGDTVWLDFQSLIAAPQGTSHAAFRGLLPAGMRPPTTYVDLALPQRASADTKGPMRVDRYGGIDIYSHTGAIRGLVSFRTSDPMITTVPGGVKL